MEQRILIATSQADFNNVNTLCKKGWILNPAVQPYNPLRLENAVVYHIIKYTEEEEETLKPTTEKVVAFVSVDNSEVNKYLGMGYEVKDSFSKTSNMVKREVVKNGAQGNKH